VKDLIFLYDQVVESLTRLHAFWSMRVNDLATHEDVEEDIDGVADLLAKRDLLIFAASARNFAEACKALGEMRSRPVRTSKLLSPPVKPFFVEGLETITLYQALSRILHSSNIDICRSAIDYEFLVSSSSDELISMIDSRRGKAVENTEPIIAIRSEQDPPTLLRLRSVVLSSCDFLNRVSDRLRAEDQIYLQRHHRELI
jgi:hypothetical protein